MIGYAAHLFDLLEWMIGPVATVDAATSGQSRPAGTAENSAVTLLRFAGGAVGSFVFSWADHTDRFRMDIEILGTEGRMAFSPRGAIRITGIAEGGRRELMPMEPDDTSSHAMYEEFLASMKDRCEPMTNAATGRRALACVLAARRSASSGRPERVAEAME